jgi:hypothetical protein
MLPLNGLTDPGPSSFSLALLASQVAAVRALAAGRAMATH